MNLKEKVDKVVIVNSKNNIKKYDLTNKNFTIEQVINNINKQLKKEQHIKQINNIYFKYKHKFNDLNEKLKTDKKIREIFLKELEEQLENIKNEEKQLIINNVKNLISKNNFNDYNNIDFSDPINFFVLTIPGVFFDLTKNSLIILGGTLINSIKQNTIKNVKKELNITLNEIDEEEYLKLKNELKQKNNININEILEENKKLKEENKQLKQLSKQLIKETEQLQQSFLTLNNFIKNDLLVLIGQLTTTNNPEQKEKLKEELKLKLQLTNNFTPKQKLKM